MGALMVHRIAEEMRKERERHKKKMQKLRAKQKKQGLRFR